MHWMCACENWPRICRDQARRFCNILHSLGFGGGKGYHSKGSRGPLDRLFLRLRGEALYQGDFRSGNIPKMILRFMGATIPKGSRRAFTAEETIFPSGVFDGQNRQKSSSSDFFHRTERPLRMSRDSIAHFHPGRCRRPPCMSCRHHPTKRT
jgi:hypothetical protein